MIHLTQFIEIIEKLRRLKNRIARLKRQVIFNFKIFQKKLSYVAKIIVTKIITHRKSISLNFQMNIEQSVVNLDLGFQDAQGCYS